MSMLSQSTSNGKQPSVAWRTGYEDARNGGSEYDGYSYFVGPNLTEYREGFSAGRIINKRLAGGSDNYVPFSDPSLNDVQPAEYREDWIGE